MFTSAFTVADIIAAIGSEADIVNSIPIETFLRWVNQFEQLIYNDVIRFEKSQVLEYDEQIPLSLLESDANERQPSLADILKVYADGRELERAGEIAFIQFKDKETYAYDNSTSETIKLNVLTEPEEIVIVWRVKPKLKTSGSEALNIPDEFFELVLCKARGEAYKLANDDASAAKWLNEYNAQLETFKMWLETNMQRYGE